MQREKKEIDDLFKQMEIYTEDERDAFLHYGEPKAEDGSTIEVTFIEISSESKPNKEL